MRGLRVAARCHWVAGVFAPVLILGPSRMENLSISWDSCWGVQRQALARARTSSRIHASDIPALDKSQSKNQSRTICAKQTGGDAFEDACGTETAEVCGVSAQNQPILKYETQKELW